MKPPYDPEQNLTFLYDQTNGKVFVLDDVKVDLNATESLKRLNDPSLISEGDPALGHSTKIDYEIITLDVPPTFEETVEIPLLINVKEQTPNLIDKIRVHILNDLIFKKTESYEITSKIKQPIGTLKGQDTKTIAGDAIIKIKPTRASAIEESSGVPL